MARIIENDQGQWIMLSGLVMAIALVFLVTLMNSAAVTGYHSSSNALEFPKDDIRDLVSQSRDATSQAVHIAHYGRGIGFKAIATIFKINNIIS